jgi:O-antigen/teichoic acid export membrane protein
MGTIASAGVALLTQIVLALAMGPDAYGEFAAALTTITIASPLAGFGVGAFLLKVFGQEGWHGLRWVEPSVHYTLLTSGAVVIGLVAWSLMAEHSTAYSILLLMLVPLVFGQAADSLVSSKLQLEERYFDLGWWQLSVNLARLCAVGALIVFIGGHLAPLQVAGGYSAIAVLFICIAMASVYSFRCGDLLLQGHDKAAVLHAESLQKPKVSAVMMSSWQFGLSGALYLLYYQSDIVLLNHFLGSEIAGLYNCAYIVVGSTYLLPAAIFQKYLLPRLHRWSAEGSNHLKAVYHDGTLWMGVIGAAGALLVIASAAYLIPLVFGAAYQPSVLLTMALAICIPIRYLSSAADAVLTSGVQLNKKVKAQAGVAFFNVAANVVLIPVYGVWISVALTIASEFAMTVALNLAARKYLATQFPQ